MTSPEDDGRSVDELIELAEALPESAGLSAGLAALRGTAADRGIAVSVNLAGMLVGLELEDEALALGAPALAGEIARLSAEAAANALREGIVAIAAVCGEELAAVIGDQLGIQRETTPAEPGPAPRRPASTVDEGDFGEVQSWAVSP
ncbi:hypothetical protein [Amycolatopsis anabasis]|uniref:hypothetical protein n=1 Tax=Amycolatopsis anabasis TaxID=1840409 RepID=UPI00131CBDF8|nr:hypothetical protein [Amycolatopsis anabasis]